VGKVCQCWSIPCGLQFQRIFVPLHAVSLLQFAGSLSILTILYSLFGERRYPHAIPPVSIVLAEVCWTSVMAILTFVSSVLSTQHGPAKMCSPSTGKRIAADAVRRSTNQEIHSQFGRVFFFHPASPRLVVGFLHLYVLSPISPDRVLTFLF
jgi:hypothetical protein